MKTEIWHKRRNLLIKTQPSPKTKKQKKNWFRETFDNHSESESEDQPNGSDEDQEPIAQIADEDASVDAELHVTFYKEKQKYWTATIILAHLMHPTFSLP